MNYHDGGCLFFPTTEKLYLSLSLGLFCIVCLLQALTLGFTTCVSNETALYFSTDINH